MMQKGHKKGDIQKLEELIGILKKNNDLEHPPSKPRRAKGNTFFQGEGTWRHVAQNGVRKTLPPCHSLSLPYFQCKDNKNGDGMG